MAKNIDKLLANILVDKGMISPEKIDDMVKEAELSSRPFSAILAEQGLAEEGKILEILSQELKLPLINLRETPIEKSITEMIPLKFTSYYKFMPVKIENRVLTIAVAYPLDVKTQDEIRTQLGYEVQMALAYEGDIHEMLKTHYGLAADTINKIISKTPRKQMEEARAEAEVEDIEKLAEEESVTKLVNQIIIEAYKRRATDIHIEPYRGKVRLRYRIDGVLHNAPVPPEMTHFYSSILSRMKIISNLNIIERRLPQDGRATVKVQDQVIDLRISSVPTPYAESLVIRLLPSKMTFDLEKLGLSKNDLKIFAELVKKPHGIIFVTGPTGSGKSTTLYTCLSQLNKDKTKIVTIEDPIEYEMEGVTQMQVLPEIGLDFAMGLRSMLRHDPDVIMIGEVRDHETAEIAIRVALTGHLVFSTLHTNDAASGVVRLIDIGLEPYLVATSVEAFIAQRLVRSICPDCKVEDTGQPEEIKEQIAKDLGLRTTYKIKLYKGKGCKKCNSTGFFGRTAIYEILLVDNVIQELILRRASSDEIKNVAIQRGMHTLRQDGWSKVLDGITTPEEVMNLTETEDKQQHKPSSIVVKTEAEVEVPQKEPAPETGPKPAKKNRRVYARLNTKVNISYKIVNVKSKSLGPKDLKEQYGTTEGISAGGLQFVSNEAISLGSILELKIDLPDADKSIVCLARVLRVELRDEETQAKIGFYISVCFLDISSAERARLNKYVEEELI
ncbi:MAG: Flp pilus assembly complex ATPase component TadA [Candidatus Omnitrophica bacterium]|nr:Flp pilus assembly complex ATPase component TadA [Candidatus Omnitrophota bacterium]